MEIRRISAQSGRSVREFYEPDPRYPHLDEVLHLMLALLDRLEVAERPPIWAFTSHFSLLLTEKDDWTESLVVVSAERKEWLDRPRFRVSYALPEPWCEAVAYTDDTALAAELVLDGLERADRGKQLE